MTEHTKEGQSPATRARRRQEQLFARPPRILPLSRTEYAEQIVGATTKLKNAVSGNNGPPIPLELCPDMVATLLKYPELWDRLSMLSVQVQCVDSKLPIRERQLAILRTVWLCGSPYQWGEHLSRTRRAGVSEAEIEQIKEGSCAAGWDAFDKAIMAAVEEFHSDMFVSDDTWNTLASHFDEQQLLELLVLIGQFANVAFVLNSLRVRLEHSNKGFLSE